MKTRRLLCALALLPLWACASAGGRTAVPVNPLQQRQLETRTFSTNDTKALMRAVLAALQDEGFIVRTADADLGLITATRESAMPPSEGQKIGRTLSIFFTYGLAALFPGPNGGSCLLEATANIAAFGSETRVRINFQLKRLENGARTKEVRTLLDSRVYQEFFAKVDKGLFLQREKLEPSSEE